MDNDLRPSSTELFLDGDYRQPAEDPGARIDRVCCDTGTVSICVRCGYAAGTATGSQFSCGHCGAVWQA